MKIGDEGTEVKIIKNGKTVFTPASEGIFDVLFSESGKYIALGSSELSNSETSVPPETQEILIFDCDDQKVKGYSATPCSGGCGSGAKPVKWTKGDQGLWVSYELNGTKGKKLLQFSGSNKSLP